MTTGLASPGLVVTRPEREALHWVQALAQAGIAAQALPLIAIGPASSLAAQTALQAAWAQMDNYHAVMFVSGNAVTYFFASNPALVGVQPAQSATNCIANDTPSAATYKPFANALWVARAWATGPGTAKALLQAGVAAELIDQPAPDLVDSTNAAVAGAVASAPVQFDSQALWRRVAHQVQPGWRVLIVRGDDSAPAPPSVPTAQPLARDWLAQQLRRADALVDEVVAYQRTLPNWTAAQHSLAQQLAADPHWVWLFSSSQAVAHLQQLLPSHNWQASRALATHPRIEAAAAQAGFGVVYPSLPTLAAVVASIKSWQ
jgi:uroporphyrinogen-III synthase